MKKSIFLRLAAIALLSAAAWLTSCDTATTDNPDSADTVSRIEQSHETASATEHTHTWQDATCTAPKTCSACSAIEGEALGHTWNDATCTEPKTCSVCMVTEGAELGHTWNDATCTKPKTCSVCSVTQGKAVGHDFSVGICNKCRSKDAAYEKDLEVFVEDVTNAQETQVKALNALVKAYENIFNSKYYETYLSSFADYLGTAYLRIGAIHGLCQSNDNLKPMANEIQASYEAILKIMEGSISSPDDISDLIGESSEHLSKASKKASQLLLEFQLK